MEISKETLYLLGGNVAMAFLAFAYASLCVVGDVALGIAESIESPDESGIFAFIMFAKVFYWIGVSIVMLLDAHYVKGYLEELQGSKDDL